VFDGEEAENLGSQRKRSWKEDKVFNSDFLNSSITGDWPSGTNVMISKIFSTNEIG
jgi:hypothetical protein